MYSNSSDLFLKRAGRRHITRDWFKRDNPSAAAAHFIYQSFETEASNGKTRWGIDKPDDCVGI